MGLLDTFDLTSVNYSAYTATTLYWLGMLAMVLIFVGVIAFALYWITYNLPVHIYEVVGKEHSLRFIRKTKAKLISKDGIQNLKIFGVKTKIMPPQSDDYMLSKGGKLLNVLKDGMEFKPFRMSSNPGHISVQQHDIRFWAAQSMKAEVQKYMEPSFMQKYGAYLVFIFGLLVLGWMYYVMIKDVSGHIDQQLALGEKVANALDKFKAAP